MQTEILKAEHLTKSFRLPLKQQKTGEKFKLAVNDLSFSAYSGEIFGLLGPNGAGKTTTLRMLATLIKPDSGDAFIDGVSGRRTIEIITAIYQSGFEGRTVSLPLPPDSPFYTVEGILKNARHFYEKSTSVENLADAGITVGGDGK